jgi:hypothetical protein
MSAYAVRLHSCITFYGPFLSHLYIFSYLQLHPPTCSCASFHPCYPSSHSLDEFWFHLLRPTWMLPYFCTAHANIDWDDTASSWTSPHAKYINFLGCISCTSTTNHNMTLQTFISLLTISSYPYFTVSFTPFITSFQGISVRSLRSARHQYYHVLYYIKHLIDAKIILGLAYHVTRVWKSASVSNQEGNNGRYYNKDVQANTSKA